MTELGVPSDIRVNYLIVIGLKTAFGSFCSLSSQRISILGASFARISKFFGPVWIIFAFLFCLRPLDQSKQEIMLILGTKKRPL